MCIIRVVVDDPVPFLCRCVRMATKKARLLKLNSEMSHLITDMLGDSPATSSANTSG